MKKKIILVVPSLNGGGAQKVIVNLARELDKNIFQVYLMVLNADGPYRALIPNDIILVNLETDNVRKSLKILVNKINEIKPHVILSTIWHMNIAILAIKNKLENNPKIVIRITNTPSEFLSSFPLTQRRILKKIIGWLYPRADKIVNQCREMEEDFVKTFNISKGLTTYIYNPVDIDYIQQQIQDNPFSTSKVNYLAVGSLTYQKGFDILINSFSKTIAEIPNAHLTILGEGKIEKKLKELVKELNLENRVDFIGFVDNPYDYFYYCDIFVLSSRWEGFPNVLLEALACKAKVVSTDCKSGPKEIIMNNQYGLLVETGNINELAEGMIQEVTNNNKSDNRAQDFKTDKITKDYEKVFLSI